MAVKNLGNALFNPYAHVKKRVSLADVINSERLYDPLKALECAPKSDGVVAVLVASEDRAKKLTDKPVWLSGYGCSMDHFIPGDPNILNGELKAAAKRAYGWPASASPSKRSTWRRSANHMPSRNSFGVSSSDYAEKGKAVT